MAESLRELAPFTVTIERLGARGDGIAHHGANVLHVPGTLPGETVRVFREEGSRALCDGDDAIIEASPERVAPFCPVYGECGGCVAQHIGSGLYAAWKRGLLEHALGRAGLETTIAQLVPAAGEGRRRLTFHAVRGDDANLRVGFMAARSHDLVAIDHCPVAEPALADAPAIAARLAEVFVSTSRDRPRSSRSARPTEPACDIHVTASLNGLDVDLRSAQGAARPGQGAAATQPKLPETLRARLIALAESCDLARLSVAGETLVMRRPPLQRMGPATVLPPAGGFLQASAMGEEILAKHVREALHARPAPGGAGKRKSRKPIRRVAELFAGSGAFTLRIAEDFAVHAVEADEAALAALDRGARETRGLKAVTHECRDLFRRPLLVPELSAYDAVVLDPPRAGCEAQARQLARAQVPLVVYVSCDPVSLARDAALLTAAGYHLETVIPIDQFAMTAHLECVAVLRK
ncbi:MAG: class I SAM-dependent RNA methyltransferase [Salinarimonas sp.]|nr:class I SAM-dependent RNA methyltransferase [Salinarimonas sp.]